MPYDSGYAMKGIPLVAILVVLVAVIIIGLQRSENNRQREEIKTLRTSLANPSMIPREAGSRNPNDLVSAGAATEGGSSPRAAGSLPTKLQDILALPDPMRRIRALLAYVDGLDAAAIPAALDDLRKSSPEWDPDAKMLAHMLLTRWGQEDPDAAFASLDSMDFKGKGADPHIILSSLASLDPKRAAEWLESPGNELVHFPWMGHILAGTVAKEWVRQDPDAALAWAATVPDNQRLGAYTGVLGTLATTDPKRASKLATELEPGGARNHIIGEIAKTWVRNDPANALSWARSLEGDERTRAVGEALGTWAQTKPAAAAGYLSKLGDDENIDTYIPKIAGNWAGQAPDEAAAWLATQPEGQGKRDAMNPLMWNWTTRDPEAAGNWLAEQPAGPARDQGIIGLGRAAIGFDPESALNWATQISDEKMRGDSIQAGIREWTRKAPEAAKEWAEANGIPSE
jgi:hypothetical protein